MYLSKNLAFLVDILKVSVVNWNDDIKWLNRNFVFCLIYRLLFLKMKEVAFFYPDFTIS